MLPTLFEEDQVTNTTVSVLEGMDAFKSDMEDYDVRKSFGRQFVDKLRR